MPKANDMRVWWIPQIPMKPFQVDVEDIAQARLLLRTLADYDAFQFENRIKPDYCNMGGLEVFEDGEWVEWESLDSGKDIHEYMEMLEPERAT
jgi:hypothetical protein